MKSYESNQNKEIINPRINLKKYNSAYIIFSLEQRPKIKEANINLSTQNITKLIAEKWNSLNKEEKEVFIQKEIEEKNKFNDSKKIKNYSYKKKLIKKPVRIRTPYMFFIQNHKSLIRNSSQYQNIEVIKDLSLKWNNMNNIDKLKYIKLSEKDKKRYEIEIEQYLSNVFSNKKKIKNKNKAEELISKLNNKSCVIKKNNKINKNKELIFSITKSTKKYKSINKYSESSSHNNMNCNTLEM